MKKIFPVLLLINLAACDLHRSHRSHSSNALPPQVSNVEVPAQVVPEASPEPGNETYMATLQPLNESVAGKISGAVTIFHEGDFLSAHVRVNGAAPKTIHGQNVHVGTICPGEAADTNLDGIIDAVEARLYSESILIPLDGDINSQYSLMSMYPVADDWGSYVYSQTASFNLFWEDLKGEDENIFDDVVKLTDATFNLESKVVIIEGVGDETSLPTSVQSRGDFTSNQSLPIACGILKRVWIVPGAIEGDDEAVGSTRNSPTDRTSGNGSGNSSPMDHRKPCLSGQPGKDCKPN